MLYVRNPPDDLPVKLRFVEDETGSILLAREPARLAFASDDPHCVHPLVVYADLLAEGHDRAQEAAGQLYDRFIDKEPEP